MNDLDTTPHGQHREAVDLAVGLGAHSVSVLRLRGTRINRFLRLRRPDVAGLARLVAVLRGVIEAQRPRAILIVDVAGREPHDVADALVGKVRALCHGYGLPAIELPDLAELSALVDDDGQNAEPAEEGPVCS